MGWMVCCHLGVFAFRPGTSQNSQLLSGCLESTSTGDGQLGLLFFLGGLTTFLPSGKLT
jgi:hypothetical protein